MDVDMLERQEKTVYGLFQKSNQKTQAKDIPALSKRFHEILGKPSGAVLPFYVLSRGFDPETENFELFIGGEMPHPSLSDMVLPAGPYARVLVRPKLGFLWGPAIGEAKRYIYVDWIESSGYTPKRIEFEYHTEAGVGKKPSIEIYFALSSSAR